MGREKKSIEFVDQEECAVTYSQRRSQYNSLSSNKLTSGDLVSAAFKKAGVSIAQKIKRLNIASEEDSTNAL